jgi:hypothetical protein
LGFDLLQLYYGDELIHDFIKPTNCHILWFGDSATATDQSLPCHANFGQKFSSKDFGLNCNSGWFKFRPIEIQR